MDIEIVHDEKRMIFYADVEGKRSVLEYEKQGNTIRCYHTFVPSELRGYHIGSKLCRAALEWAKAEGYMVHPTCSFVRLYARRKKEYRDIIA